MCSKIIEFPVNGVQRTESTECSNFTSLIDLVDDSAELEFYEVMLIKGEENGELLPGEFEKLTEKIRKIEKIRQMRLDLAKPWKMAPQEVTGPGLYIYCPEMGESRPECQIIAQRSYYGKHFHISTPLSLKGRGITFDGVKKAENLTENSRFMDGWNEYTVTQRAFDKLREQYSISMESLLD